jgi:hypothetical protein
VSERVFVCEMEARESGKKKKERERVVNAGPYVDYLVIVLSRLICSVATQPTTRGAILSPKYPQLSILHKTPTISSKYIGPFVCTSVW